MVDHRKIIALGRSTLCLTLPKEWVEKNSLAKGGVVVVNEDAQGHLLISSEDVKVEQKERERVIEAKDKDKDTLHREIAAAYVQGSTMVVVRSCTDPRIFDAFMGTKVILKESSLLASISSDSSDLQSILKRLDMINRTLLDETRVLFEKKKGKVLFTSMEDVERLCYAALRTITCAFEDPRMVKQLGISIHEMLFLWQVIDKLRKIAERIWGIRRLTEKELSKEARTLLQKHFMNLEVLYRDTVSAYYKHDKATANALIEQHADYRSELGSLYNLQNKEVALFAELARRVSSIAEDIATICLERL